MSLSTSRTRRHGAAMAAVLLAATTVLTACGSGSKESAGSSDNRDPIVLFTDNPAWKDGFKQVGDAMEKVTGHNLTMQSNPVQANYQQVMEQSLAAKPADIVKTSNGLLMQKVAATGNLTDLTAVWDEAIAKGWLDESVRPYYTQNGKQYAVPLTRSYWVVFYNKSVFDKAGVKAPTTYPEFTAAAEKLKQSGVTPIWSAGADGWPPFIPFQSLVGAVSPDYYNRLTENKAKFDDPEGKQVLSLWQTWLKSGWTTPYDAKLEEAPALLKSGKVAMWPVGTWAAQMLKKAGMKPGVDYGAFLMPQVDAGSPQAVFFEGNGFGVPVKAPHHDDAVKQIKAWLDPSVQKVWSDYLDDASPNITVPVANPVIAAVSDAVKSTGAKPLLRFFEAFPPTLVQEATTAWGDFMLHPDNPDKPATTLRKAAEQDWDQWKQQNP